MMTQKQFIAIAAAVKASRDMFGDAEEGTAYDYVLNDVTTRLADVCEGENERFDREKFLAACGYL